MSWHTGTEDGYVELLGTLLDLATNSAVATVAVNAGGSGYAVGDVLTINGGTTVNSLTAAVEVLTVSGGAATSVRIARGGAYTVNPGTGATTTAETGAGTGCTIDTTISSLGWAVERRTQEAVSATVSSGGSGHAVNDQLTVHIGDGVQGGEGVDAVFNVDSVSSGAVTAVSLVTAGNYQESPSNAASTTSSGAGTGCELTVTWQDATTSNSQVVVLSGTPGGGFTKPYVAIWLYEDTDQFLGSEPVRNWALFGMTGFNALLPLHQQPGISTGFDLDTNDGTLERAPVVPLKETDATYPITYWFSITTRRIIGVFHTTNSTPVNHYPSMYLGLLNQPGTRLEYPYPLYVAGGGWRPKTQYAETGPIITGISQACGGYTTTGASEGYASAYFYDTATATWYSSLNFDWNDAGTVLETDEDEYVHGVYPLMRAHSDDTSSASYAYGANYTDAINIIVELVDYDATTSPEVQLYPTPDTGDDKYLLWPCAVIGKWNQYSNAVGVDTSLNNNFGEVDSVFWLSAYPVGDVTTLDTFLNGSDRYRVFQNGNQTDPNRSYMAIREE